MSSKWDQFIVSQPNVETPTTDVAPTSQDKWSQYIVQKPETAKASEDVAKSFKFFGFEPKAETIESIRQPVGAALKRFAGGILGTPGDIEQLARSVTGTEKRQILPTSKEVESGFEKVSGQEYKPKGTAQEILAETSGALGSILGLGGPLKGASLLKSLTRTGLGAFVPATTSVISGKAELPDWMQASAVIGSGILTHRITGKSMRQIEKELYKQADTMAEKVMLPTDNLTTRLDKLQSKMSEGLSTGPKDRINKMIDELKAKASGGAIPLPNLMQARRDAIEVSKEFTREVRKGSERYWSGLRQAIDDTVGDYEKINPEFSQVYRQANSLHRGLNEARIIEKFIISHPILSSTAAGGEFFLHTLGHALVGPSITAGGAVVGKLTEFAIAMKRNPGLRKAWQDVMKDASKNEVRATLNSLRKFHKEAKEEGLTD
jgi:hypothetical protein